MTTTQQPLDYFSTLHAWAADKPGITVEATNNDLAWFVTVRREDGLSATGTHCHDIDAAARSAARLFTIKRRAH